MAPNATSVRRQTGAPPSTGLGRYAEPDDVAATVAFLAGPHAAFITGATVNVDGGFTI